MNASTTSDRREPRARPQRRPRRRRGSGAASREGAPAAAWTTPAKSKHFELEQRVDVEQVAVAVERAEAAEDPQVAEHVDQQEDEQEERAAVERDARNRNRHARGRARRDARASGRPRAPPSSARGGRRNVGLLRRRLFARSGSCDRGGTSKIQKMDRNRRGGCPGQAPRVCRALVCWSRPRDPACSDAARLEQAQARSALRRNTPRRTRGRPCAPARRPARRELRPNFVDAITAGADRVGQGEALRGRRRHGAARRRRAARARRRVRGATTPRSNVGRARAARARG